MDSPTPLRPQLTRRRARGHIIPMSTLDGLMTPPENSPAPTPAASPAPTPDAPAGPSATPDLSAFPVAAAIASGKIPGVYIPKGFKGKAAPGLTAQVLIKSGLGIYRPTSPDIQAVLFNAKTVPVAALKQADKAGELAQVLPPITAFTDASKAPQGAAAGASDEQSPEPSAPDTVPVLPRPSSSRVQSSTLRNLAPQTPSGRQIPGAGTVLNGLLPKAL